MTWSVLPLPKAPREAAAQRRPADVSGQPHFFRKTSDRMVCNARRPHWKCFDAGRSPQPCETTCHIGRPQAPTPPSVPFSLRADRRSCFLRCPRAPRLFFALWMQAALSPLRGTAAWWRKRCRAHTRTAARKARRPYPARRPALLENRIQHSKIINNFISSRLRDTYI